MWDEDYKKIAALGLASVQPFRMHDLYRLAGTSPGQLAQPTNLARPAECFAVEKLLIGLLHRYG